MKPLSRSAPPAPTFAAWVRERRGRPWVLAAKGRATVGLAIGAGLGWLRANAPHGDLTVLPDGRHPDDGL